MSSFKVETMITTIDSAGKQTRKSWSAATASLTDVQWKNISISNGAVKFVWNPTVWSDYEPSLFSVLTMVADGNLDVEMTINTGDANLEYNSFRLAKNYPFVLGADDAYYNHAATTDAAFGGTLDVIDSIRVAEPSTGSVNLTMILGN